MASFSTVYCFGLCLLNPSGTKFCVLKDTCTQTPQQEIIYVSIIEFYKSYLYFLIMLEFLLKTLTLLTECKKFNVFKNLSDFFFFYRYLIYFYCIILFQIQNHEKTRAFYYSNNHSPQLYNWHPTSNISNDFYRCSAFRCFYDNFIIIAFSIVNVFYYKILSILLISRHFNRVMSVTIKFFNCMYAIACTESVFSDKTF